MDIQPIWIAGAAIFGMLVGLPTGMAGALMLLRRANQSVELKDSTEQLLADNVKPEIVKEIHETTKQVIAMANNLIELVREGGRFVLDVTDGQPNAPAPEVSAKRGTAH